MDISDDVYKGLLGLLISAVVIIIGFSFFLKRRRVLKNGVRVAGTLMEWKTAAGKAPHSYHPVVGYHAGDDRWIVKEYEISRSYQNLKVGDDIILIYNNLQPEEFILEDSSSKAAGPLFFVIGAAGLIGSVVYLILKY